MNERELIPKDRLLATASRLFYIEGIHSISVDRLVSEADVSRATFYRQFPTKEALVQAYLRANDARLRDLSLIRLPELLLGSDLTPCRRSG